MASAAAGTSARRRFVVPEVVQISNMDCGPASLKCLLDGYGIPANYGRLREACQTDLDGTSIDTIEIMAGQLGLAAEQVLLPADHLALPEGGCLPAIVVMRLPNGATHFVVVWRRHGGLLQVMDPGGGRRWVPVQRLLEDVYEHVHGVPAAAWREWAGTDDFLCVLRARLYRIGAASQSARLIGPALADPAWRPLAALDAALRMTEALVRSGGVRRGREAVRVLDTLFERALQEAAEQCEVVPQEYWAVRAIEGPDEREWLAVRGVVMLRVHGRTEAPPAPAAGVAQRELAAAIEPAARGTLRRLLGALREDRVLSPVPIGLALAAVSCAVIVEGLVLRTLLEISGLLGSGSERVLVVSALVSYAAIVALLDLPLSAAGYRAGRALEGRLRVAFLRKVTRLRDRYFQSRLISDMVERGHSIHLLRTFPPVALQLIRSGLTVMVLTGGVIWLHPSSAAAVVVIAFASVGVPLAAQALVAERELRVRTLSAVLSRFYLDAMLGLLAIRSCVAERQVRREQEGVVTEWVRSGLRYQRAAVTVETLGAVLVYGLIAAVLLRVFSESSEAGSMLLLVYWLLALPASAHEFAGLALQYPAFRNTAQRVFEPLDAPEDPESAGAAEDQSAPPVAPAVELEHVSVRVAGHAILEDVSLAIPAGAHVAVVGASGAGKTTLLGLLLGWHFPSSGRVRVDGAEVNEATIERLRSATAWVDPTIHIWNTTLLANLLYGSEERGANALGPVLAGADLEAVVAALPLSLQSPLGENGAQLSGGEGQRVRLGRAMLRRDARLVLLDEPLRGLDRDQRHRLLARARAWWRSATLICVTHDVAEARGFDHVIVLHAGRLVEQGSPEALAERADSWFGRMLADQQAVLRELESGAAWRRCRMVDGRIVESHAAEARP